MIATASMDSTIKITTITPELPKTVYNLRQHQGPVSSIRCSTFASQLLSAGWDGTIALWDVREPSQQTMALAERSNEVDNNRSKKRRKRLDEDNLVTLKPVHQLEGHKGKVSRAIFDKTDKTKAYSAGSDHSVREWNLEYGVEISARVSNHFWGSNKGHKIPLVRPRTRRS